MSHWINDMPTEGVLFVEGVTLDEMKVQMAYNRIPIAVINELLFSDAANRVTIDGGENHGIVDDVLNSDMPECIIVLGKWRLLEGYRLTSQPISSGTLHVLQHYKSRHFVVQNGQVSEIEH